MKWQAIRSERLHRKQWGQEETPEEEDMSDDECIEPVETHFDISMVSPSDGVPEQLGPAAAGTPAVVIESDAEHDAKGEVRGTFKDRCNQP